MSGRKPTGPKISLWEVATIVALALGAVVLFWWMTAPAQAANWPNQVSTDATLYKAVNNGFTYLTADIDAAVTTLPVSSPAGFPLVSFVTIDGEAILCTSSTTVSFTNCTRGADGTTAAAHTKSTRAYFDVVAAHHNVLKDELIAMSTYFLQGSAVHIDTTNARVGIGTAAPSTALEVIGEVKAATFTATGIVASAGGVSFGDGTVITSTAGIVLSKGPEPWIDTKAVGAKGDGLADDTSALQVFVNSNAGYYTLRFSSGVYLLNNLQFTGKSHIRLIGAPGAVLRWGGTDRIMTFSTCTNVGLDNLEIDNRGVVDQYSGVAFYACQNVWLDHNHVFDSNVTAGGSNDRYSFYSGAGTLPSQNIWVTNNLIEDLQMEFDNFRHLHVLGNTVIHSKRAASIGFFNVNSGIESWDADVGGNIILDPQSVGITAVLDPANTNNSAFRRMKFHDNLVVFTTTDTHRGFVLGTGDNSQVTSGNVFEDIDFTNNRVEYLGGGAGVEGFFFNGSSAGNYWFKNVKVRGNTVLGNGGGTCYDIRRVGGLTLAGNDAFNCSVGFNLAGSTGSNVAYNNFASSCTIPYQFSAMDPSDILLIVSTSGYVGINNTNPTTHLVVGGTVTATNFSGSGSLLTGIPPAAITAGSLGASVLTSSVAVGSILDAQITGPVSGSKIGSGVPAANIASGSLGSNVIASSIAVSAVGSSQLAAMTLPTSVVASSVPASAVQPGSLGSSVIASSVAVNAIANAQVASSAGLNLSKLSLADNVTWTGAHTFNPGASSTLFGGTNATQVIVQPNGPSAQSGILAVRPFGSASSYMQLQDKDGNSWFLFYSNGTVTEHYAYTQIVRFRLGALQRASWGRIASSFEPVFRFGDDNDPTDGEPTMHVIMTRATGDAFGVDAPSGTRAFTVSKSSTIVNQQVYISTTATQLRLNYSASKYADLSADGNGNLILAPQNQAVNVTGLITASNAGATTNSFSSTGADNSHSFNINAARYSTIGLNANTNTTSPGDASIRFQENGTHKAEIGIDNSDSDKLKLFGVGSAAGFGTNTAGITIDSTGKTGVGTVSPSGRFEVAAITADTYSLVVSSANNTTHHLTVDSRDGLVYPQSATSATIQALPPKASGGLIFNSDIVEICVSTGTAAGAFKRLNGGATCW